MQKTGDKSVSFNAYSESAGRSSVTLDTEGSSRLRERMRAVPSIVEESSCSEEEEEEEEEEEDSKDELYENVTRTCTTTVEQGEKGKGRSSELRNSEGPKEKRRKTRAMLDNSDEITPTASSGESLRASVDYRQGIETKL